MNVAELLCAQAAERPDAPAIIDTFRGRSRTTTFAQLEAASQRLAFLLHRKGIAPGSTVLVLQPMSCELYIALMAICRLGLVAMFLDPAAGRQHIESCCALCPPQAFIGSAKAHLLRCIVPALQCVPIKISVGVAVPGAIPWKAIERLEPRAEFQPCQPADAALLTFTSGSTAQPKAVVRTHEFLLTQHGVLARHLKLELGQRDLSTLPIFLLANLASGATSIIPNVDLRRPGAVDAARVVQQIAKQKPTRAAASPAFFERLCDYTEQMGSDLSGLQQVYLGGAPVFPGLLSQLHHLAPNADITAVYGSAEAEPIAYVEYKDIAPEDKQAMASGRGLLAGRTVEEIELRIIQDQWGKPLGPLKCEEFEKLHQPVDVPGEIVVSGEHVLKGYLNGQGSKETKINVNSEVWHRTGDSGYIDKTGRLWLMGRCAARVTDERGTVYPFAVECIALKHPAVRRAAVVAHRHQRLLAVELRCSQRRFDSRQLKDAVAWAHIDELRVIPRIPMDKRHNAKVDYLALARILK